MFVHLFKSASFLGPNIIPCYRPRTTRSQAVARIADRTASQQTI